MTQNGTLYQLPALVSRTQENASGLLPTPTMRDYKDVSSKGASPSASNRKSPCLVVVGYLNGLTPGYEAELYREVMGYPEDWHVTQ